MAVQEEDDERRREEVFHSHISSSSPFLTPTLINEGEGRGKEEESNVGVESRASNKQVSSVMHPFTVTSEPVCSVELKETKSVCVMERVCLSPTSMNGVNAYLHTLKSNMSVSTALSLVTDMTVLKLDERVTGRVSRSFTKSE